MFLLLFLFCVIVMGFVDVFVVVLLCLMFRRFLSFLSSRDSSKYDKNEIQYVTQVIF